MTTKTIVKFALSYQKSLLIDKKQGYFYSLVNFFTVKNQQ